MRRRGASLLPVLSLLVFLGGWDDLDYTTESGAAWFAAHKSEVLGLTRRLLARPEIAWVEPGLTLKYVPKFANFTPESEAIYRRLEAKAEDLGIDIIAVFRKRSDIDGELISVRYTLKRRGFVFTSSDALSIEYILSETLLKALRETPGTQVAPLDVEGWYAVVTHDD